MKSFGVNANNDMYIGPDGNLVISTGLQAVLEVCAQKTKTILGELVLNVDQGIPYFQSVFSGTQNLQQFAAYLRSTILVVPGVTGINSLNFSKVGDTLIYVIEINTIYGNGTVTDG